MKKYIIGCAYATNLPEYFVADMEPTLSLEDCRKLPLATPLSDGVVFNEIEHIDSPFSLYSENDSFLLHIKTTASGPALAFVSDVVAVRAMMDKLGGSRLHLGLNADGVKADRALLIVPYSLELYTRAVSYISFGELKRDTSKKPAAPAPKPAPVANSAPKPAPVANSAPKPAPAAPAPKPAPVANPAPKPAPVANPAPKPAPAAPAPEPTLNPFDGEPGSVRRVPDKPAPKPAPNPFDGESGSVRRVPG